MNKKDTTQKPKVNKELLKQSIKDKNKALKGNKTVLK